MTLHTCPTLSFVVPCYDEEEVLPETAGRLADKLSNLVERRIVSEGSAVYFVDDGSRDGTWPLIETLAHGNAIFHGIKLSANNGHQNALL